MKKFTFDVSGEGIQNKEVDVHPGDEVDFVVDDRLRDRDIVVESKTNGIDDDELFGHGTIPVNGPGTIRRGVVYDRAKRARFELSLRKAHGGKHEPTTGKINVGSGPDPEGG